MNKFNLVERLGMHLMGFYVFLIAVAVAINLTGCSDTHDSKYIEDDKDATTIEYEDVAPLILIKEEEIEGCGGIDEAIFYDPETKVMYNRFVNANKDEGLHEMHNADGTLRTYDGKSDVKVLTFICEVPIENTDIKQYVFFDPETLVMFVRYTNVYDRGISEMHNADGSLRIYNPEQ